MKAASTRRARIVLLIALAPILLVALSPAARAQRPQILFAIVDGAIDRSTVDYLQEAIDEARAGGYAALMIRFDTPGGGLAETVAIAEMFNNARDVPILGWVGPAGAHAWSAGTILLVSTDLAAMAPGTTIGSVQPVEVGPGGVVPVTDEKIINAVVGAIAEELSLNGRNVTLADAFVRDNLNLNATQAQAVGATELVASSPSEFADLANGRTTVYKGLSLATANAEIVTFSPSARVRLLEILSDPLVASLLLILGIYLVIFGVTTPGHGAEIAGIIILLLALIGLGFSVDPIALLLFIVGVVLIIIEVKTPGHGVFGIGGIIAYKVQQVRRQKPRVGEMIGEGATVVDGLRAGEKGYVRTRGELWQALSDQDQPADAKVYIHGIEGITLHVAASPPPPPAPAPIRQRFASLLRRKAA